MGRSRLIGRQIKAGDPGLRLLVGPFTEAITSEYMVGAFDDFDTLTFGNWPGADLEVAGLPTLADILALLPSDWEPDLILLWRPEYGYIPLGLEDSPYPTAMLISDWYLAFSDCLEAGWRVDAVVTGTRGLRAFRAAGFDHVVAMPMLGYQAELDGQFQLPPEQRDLDVFCGGNANMVIHQQREQILAELLELPGDIRVAHGPYVDRPEYCRLLGRSKIYVDQTVIGEINMKVYEVTAAGTCLFVEEDNLDIRDYLTPDESVVLYNRSNLREKVCYWLGHESERLAVAQRAQAAMAKLTYQTNFRAIVEYLSGVLLKPGVGRQRPCGELSPVDQSEGLAGYALLHNGGDLLAPVVLSRSADTDGSARSLLLEAAALYQARSGAADFTALGTDDVAWNDEKILALFRAAHQRDPEYLPAAFAWAQLAASHLAAGLALPLLDHVRRLLVSGCGIPFGCAEYFHLAREVRFVFERAAWEALERGASLASALRPILLEEVLITQARLARDTGALPLAGTLLEQAVQARPDGFRTRPLLAAWLAEYGEWQRAEVVWREHLAAHPLDLKGHEELLALAVRSGRTEGPAAADRRRYEGLKDMFGVVQESQP